MNRLGLKFLFLSLDKKTYDYVSRIPDMYPITFDKVIIEDSVTFLSKPFNILTRAKMGISYEALRLGYDVLFMDTDVVVIRDPIPMMRWNYIDYVFAVNKFCPE